MKQIAHMEDLGIHGRRLLKWILKKQQEDVDSSGLEKGSVKGYYENWNKNSDSTKLMKFLG